MFYTKALAIGYGLLIYLLVAHCEINKMYYYKVGNGNDMDSSSPMHLRTHQLVQHQLLLAVTKASSRKSIQHLDYYISTSLSHATHAFNLPIYKFLHANNKTIVHLQIFCHLHQQTNNHLCKIG